MRHLSIPLSLRNIFGNQHSPSAAGLCRLERVQDIYSVERAFQETTPILVFSEDQIPADRLGHEIETAIVADLEELIGWQEWEIENLHRHFHADNEEAEPSDACPDLTSPYLREENISVDTAYRLNYPDGRARLLFKLYDTLPSRIEPQLVEISVRSALETVSSLQPSP